MSVNLLQTKTLDNVHPGSPFSLTFDSSTINSSMIIFSYLVGTGITFSVSDNKGNSYAELSSKDSGAGHTLHVVAAFNIAGGASHSITITPSIDGTTSLIMEEWSGISPSSAFDKTSSAAGNNTSPDSGSTSTTTRSSELIWGAAYILIFNSDFSPATVGAGSGFANLHNAGASYTESKTVSSIGTYNAPYIMTISGTPPLVPEWAAIVVTLTAIVTTPKTLAAIVSNVVGLSTFKARFLSLNVTSTAITVLATKALFKRTFAVTASVVTNLRRLINKSLAAAVTSAVNLVANKRVPDIGAKGRIDTPKNQKKPWSK